MILCINRNSSYSGLVIIGVTAVCRNPGMAGTSAIVMSITSTSAITISIVAMSIVAISIVAKSIAVSAIATFIIVKSIVANLH